ncbi:MAG TPA: 5-formyltetrahydrofolate cyclo-ligase [Noviherbaspirillum sp.]|jgi:5,10-methenyltetrahydrofolate synthetase|uniref:5-formyltetrahydrofolate cyclo-ligase n=1 Tax=Noviherbaspirillum sp. TaxID=1926288 RepID=UPI002F92257A
MPDDTSTKAGLRAMLLAQRQAIAPEVRHVWDAAIGSNVLAWCARHGVRTLGVYWPIRSEPQLHHAYAELDARGVRLALPTVTSATRPLVFVAWRPGEPTRRDAHGVPVPVSGVECVPEALLVPCVGFNEAGYRLGYGGGYYDRTLAQAPRPKTAGIAYASARVRFEPDAFDVALDTIITEQA